VIGRRTFALRGGAAVALTLPSPGGAATSRAELVEDLRRVYRRRRLRVEADPRRLERAGRSGVAIDAHAVAELLLASDLLLDRPASSSGRRGHEPPR
jgi:hypothetical protein